MAGGIVELFDSESIRVGCDVHYQNTYLFLTKMIRHLSVRQDIAQRCSYQILVSKSTYVL